MDEDLDLDSFIQNIEQTAPKHSADSAELRCQHCDTPLEELDSIWTCPNCGAQATDILQLEETELNYDESGRPIVGQRVRFEAKRRIKEVDYGWAWSTDDAVSHILSLQVDALEKAGLLPERFREAVANMWFKYWFEFVAPYIKDVYTGKDLIPIEAMRAMKLRDIEVLVKVKDKVMLPNVSCNSKELASQQACADQVRRRWRRRNYKSMGLNYFKPSQEHTSQANAAAHASDSGQSDSAESGHSNAGAPSSAAARASSRGGSCSSWMQEEQLDDIGGAHRPPAGSADDGPAPSVAPQQRLSTKNLNSETVIILTLDRTLAFLEATSRCIQDSDPLFAADIIRACNQRLIPFFGAHKSLPKGMQLTSKDVFMFRKIRPPSPEQLTRTATHLIYRIYRDQMPMYIPVPDLSIILKRFMHDLNLPEQLYDMIKDTYSFIDFAQTRPIKLQSKAIRILPQYDRYTFAVLVFHLKRLFHLGDKYVNKQQRRADEKSHKHQVEYFAFAQWLQQLSLRLQTIFTHDPFVLFHPSAMVKHFETSPQMLKYIEILIGDRVQTTQPLSDGGHLLEYDHQMRNDLTEFLCRELPRPRGYEKILSYLNTDDQLDHSANIKYPVLDSLRRTKKYWRVEMRKEEDKYELMRRDFSKAKVVTLKHVPKWTYDSEYMKLVCCKKLPNKSLNSSWPNALKLILMAGGFLCFCEPFDLLDEVVRVEATIYPRQRGVTAARARILKQRQQERSSSASEETVIVSESEYMA